jgi:hypothetical protein
MDLQPSCWASLRILGQPCEFQVGRSHRRHAKCVADAAAFCDASAERLAEGEYVIK